jgi:hypothetical protein
VIQGVELGPRKHQCIRQQLRANQPLSWASSLRSPQQSPQHVAHPVAKGIDDLDVHDIRDSILSIAEMFHVVSEAFIMLVSDGLQGFSYKWTLVRTLVVSDEHDT